ncbi:MAG: hypothetical protein QGH93_11045, partial [Gammaproteobacteria bacterium]|nr:hypothetical protein [Gammaproteobacteria bacterium]
MRVIAIWAFGFSVVCGCAVAAEMPIRFIDAAEQAGLADLAVNSTGPTFVDYDQDGDLDIFV